MELKNSSGAVTSIPANSSRESRFERLDWILPMATHVLLILIIIWLFISLIHYGLKTKRWCTSQRCKSEKMNSGLVYASVIACAFFCVVFLSANIAYINVGFAPGADEICDLMSDAVSVFYGLILICVMTFLWLRQRVFYDNFLLNLEYGRCLRIFSSVCIILILIPGIASLVLNTLPNDSFGSLQGCIYMPDDQLRVVYWVSVVLVLVFGQLTMQVLFGYALKKTSGESLTNGCFWCCYEQPNVKRRHLSSSSKSSTSKIRNMNHSSSTDSTISYHSKTVSTTSLPQKDQALAVQHILWKTLVFAILSTISDVLAQIVIHYLPQPENHRRISATVVAVNSFLNLLFLILSFATYKEILLSPWISIKRKWFKCCETETDFAITTE